jgi:hypothetical protein
MADGTDLFELLADSTRAGILRALATNQGEHPGEPMLSFATLRERVGAEDSGNFSYHLDKLRDRFVRKTETGYTLTAAGLRLVGAIQSTASITDGIEYEPVDLGDLCPICDGELTASYADGFFQVACPNEHFFPVTTLPAGALEERSLEAAVELATVTTNDDVDLLRRGACPRCYATVDSRLVENESEASPVRFRFAAACPQCGMAYGGPAGLCALADHRVAGVFAQGGLDARAEPHWRFDIWSPATVSVLEEAPLALSITISHETDTVDVIVDEALDVRLT